MFFQSLGGRRAGWITEAIKVDAVSNTSGCLKEGVHEGLKLKLLGVGNLERRQLLSFDFLAMDPDQR